MSSTRRVAPLVSLCLLMGTSAAAQGVPVVRFTVQEGLAQSQVTTLLQDATGFLWIGTQGGLSRFDGHRFRTWTAQEGLPDDVITSLATDQEGRLWIGTDSGAVAFLDRAGTIRTLVESVGGKGEPVDALAALPGGLLLAATPSGLRRLGPHEPPTPILPDRIVTLVRDEGGRLWAVGDRVARPLGRRGQPGAPIPLPAPVGTAVAAGRGLLLCLEDGRLMRLTGTAAAVVGDTGVTRVTAMAPGAGGMLWLGNENGLWRWRAGTEAEPVRLAVGAVRVQVRRLLAGREGELWIGGWGQGLFEMPPGDLTLYTPATGLPANTVWGLAEGPDGCIWMATGGGGVVSFRGNRPGPRLTRASGLPSDLALCVLAGRDGALWVGTDRGLVRRTPGGALRLWSGRDGPPDPFIRDLVQDRAGTLWVATSNGLAAWTRGRWRVWRVADGLPCPLIRGLAVGADGVLWLATHTAGVVRFDGTTFRSFTTRDGLPADRVWSVMVDRKGRVWGGTDAGIWLHDPRNRTADRIIGRREGLPNQNILFLVQDRGGDVWVGTTRGVARLDEDGRVLAVLTATDGLPGTEAAENAALCDSGGAVWLGMAGGVARLTPSRLSGPSPGLKLVLERVAADGRPVDSRAVAARRLRLPPGTNEVRFELTAPCLRNPGRLRFRYRLDRQDRAWSLPTDERHVTYRRLPPGRYRFRARLEDTAGTPLAEELDCDLELQPFWYQTPVARWGGLALLALVAAGAVLGRFHALEARRRELERLVRERTRDLAEANARLEALSRTDPLTGLGNRRVLAEALPVEMRLARREVSREGAGVLPHMRGVGLVMLDLDHFKQINDRHGHDAGDAVLRAVAAAVQGAVREVDEVVRWGGEEILVMARSITPAGIRELTRRVVDAVAALRVLTGSGEVVTPRASAGFMCYPLAVRAPAQGEAAWEWAVEVVDGLLYLAKRRGRSRAVGIVVTSPTPEDMDEDTLVRQILDDPEHPPAGIGVVELRCP